MAARWSLDSAGHIQPMVHHPCYHCRLQVSQALFDPPPFQPEKLRIQYAPGTSQLDPAPPLRRYTLTHNDITGMLSLSIGPDYNHQQISGFYTRLLRDEVTAEWKSTAAGYALHVYCHVSGEERWLAPPMLRNYIFRREMPLVRGATMLVRTLAQVVYACLPHKWCTHLAGASCAPAQHTRDASRSASFPARVQVLDTFLYADAQLVRRLPQLQASPVYIHFQSSVQVGGWVMTRCCAQLDAAIMRVLLACGGFCRGSADADHAAGRSMHACMHAGPSERAVHLCVLFRSWTR